MTQVNASYRKLTPHYTRTGKHKGFIYGRCFEHNAGRLSAPLNTKSTVDF